MMLHESELKLSARLVANCERDLGRGITCGQAVDLICDNHCEWGLDKCQAIAASLYAGHGVGAFYMVEARKCG